MPDKLNRSFLPSSRSLAFRKKAWKQVGGYPENLDTAEDLVFAQVLKQSGMAIDIACEAIVYWPQKRTWLEAFWQLFRYAQGDGQALYIRVATPLLWVRVLTAAALLAWAAHSPTPGSLTTVATLALLYFLWAIFKNKRYVPHWQAFFILPMLQMLSDVAVPLGMTSGIIRRYTSKSRKS